MLHKHAFKFGLLTLATSGIVACGGQPVADNAASPGAASPSGETIKIGALMPITGDLQSYGETSLNGINLAIKEINASGGVLGRPLEVAVGDTQTAAQPSIDAAQRLISVEGVFGLIGALSSGNTIPVAQSISSANSIPQITSASTSPVITTLQDNDFLFRTVPSDAFQGIALAEIVQANDLDNLAIIYVNNDYGQGLAESFQAAFEALGGTIADSVPYEPGQASYRGELQQLASTGATALALIGYPENGITILKQSLEEEFFNTFVFSDGMKAPEVIDAIGADVLEGAFGTVPQAATETAAYDTFSKSYNAEFGELPPKPYIDTSYDAVMLLAMALQQAGETDGVAVRDALRQVANAPGLAVNPGEWDKAITAIQNGEDVDYTGASGNLELDDNGDVGGSFAHWAIQNGEIVTIEVFEPQL